MAVYTPVSDADLANFLESYDVGHAISFKGIAEGVENTNYFLQTDRDRYILTLFEKRVPKQDLPFFMALMNHVVEAGLPAAAPVSNSAGQTLGQLNGRPAALIAFLDGTSKTAPEKAACAACGTMLARLHQATADFDQTRDNAFSLPGWQRLAQDCKAEANRCADDLNTFIRDELAFLQQHWPGPDALPRAVVHTDLFPDNVLFRDNRISGVIDFYFACTDFYAFDLAVTLNAWCFDETHVFQVDHARALLMAYQEHRPLDAAEKKALPVFLRGSALRFVLTRLYDWINQDPIALVSVKDPLEYRDKLRFHQQNDFWNLIDE
ncbi:homoserine kinase [Parvularcula sp. IMCC14364]|uniref:homoserine kinase n=1 Tax=Parvularcula sp. IMCC14364 TaxID=3067902 RepID=UPI0027412FC0|nr:homoserine kinase [Parvularcula sp. IMCC14364]